MARSFPPQLTTQANEILNELSTRAVDGEPAIVSQTRRPATLLGANSQISEEASYSQATPSTEHF